MDLENVKYAHIVNLKAYKDDPQKVVVFLSVQFFTSQGRIICEISKLDDNLHPKSCEKARFKVAKFPNRTARLIHQMWDEMVIVIVIKKDNKMARTCETARIDIKGSSMIRAPKKQKKEAKIKEKREKMINNLVMKKYFKGLDETECKHAHESIKNEFSDYFPLGNKPVERVKVLLDRFLPLPRKIMYHPLSDTHKNKIKH
jgi:hypothetical protein